MGGGLMGIHQLDIFQGYKKKKKKLSLNNRLKMKYCNYLSVSKAFLVFVFYFNKFQSLYTHQKRIASWYYYIRFKNRTDVSPPYWHHIDINPLINTIYASVPLSTPFGYIFSCGCLKSKYSDCSHSEWLH